MEHCYSAIKRVKSHHLSQNSGIRAVHQAKQPKPRKRVAFVSKMKAKTIVHRM